MEKLFQTLDNQGVGVVENYSCSSCKISILIMILSVVLTLHYSPLQQTLILMMFKCLNASYQRNVKK